MNSQLTYKEHEAAQIKFPLILMTDNLMGEANIGSLFRLADAFSIEKIIFCGSPVNLNSNRLKRTARATIQNVDFEYYKEAVEAIERYTSLGYQPYALEITADSRPLDSINFEKEKKILLIAGNERHGISNQLLEKIGSRIHIKMFGRNSSMNVAQATGIALYEITKTLPAFPQK